MSKIVIVFHSGYGHTAKVAQAVAEGSGGSLLAIDAEGNLPAGGWEQLAAAKAIVFGSPTYMGSVSWQFKKFADASSKAWFTQAWKDKIAAGDGHSVGIQANGTLWCWGANADGQLGNGSTLDRDGPVQVGDARDWVLPGAGAQHSLAIRTDGSLWAWGRNAAGQLGLGDLVSRTTPTALP